MIRRSAPWGALLLAAAAWLAPAAPALAAKIADISNTKHNLSASGQGPVKATTESQILLFDLA